MGREILTALADHDVDGELVRILDQSVMFGVSIDEGDGDGWRCRDEIPRRQRRPRGAPARE